MRQTATLSFLYFAVAGFLGSTSASASVPDSLYSKRLSKRFIDDDGNYNISFYHVNDVHAHLDQFAASGADCTEPEKGCYGGYARIKTAVESTRPEHQDSLWLNAGDEWQGTLFFTYYGGEKIADTLNQLGVDVMTLGNHEFDRGDEQLGDFIQNLTFPVVSSNVVSTNKVLNSTIKPYQIFEKYQLAVIGATTESTARISNPGNGTTFINSTAAIQASIDEIRSTTNITRVVALTHIGYEEDKRLAQETTGLHLIVGGHSHTLLGDMPGAEGKYPTIETNKDGDEVFIVTAYRWGEYLGYIDVTYDAEGKILAYHGAPIHMTNTTAQDKGLQAQIDEWRVPFEKYAAEQIGTTNVLLDHSDCKTRECTLGDLVSDALLQYRVDAGSDPAFAFINGGGIRASIDVGNITRGQVLTSFPFGNAAVEVTWSGADLWKIFEGLVSGTNQFNQEKIDSIAQVSRGIKVEYNPDNAVGSRLVRLTIDNKPVDQAAEYRVVTVDYVAGGGDNIVVSVGDVSALDTVADVLSDYIQNQTSPIDFQLEGRIATVQGSAGDNGTGAGAGASTADSDQSGAESISGIPSSLVVSLIASLSGLAMS
ncbi:Metallo-dependent phosphatase [Hypoxylon sp. FL1284]|nr:Metallo-dependent phosphatase [Hypoxylon sp. FL1284]